MTNLRRTTENLSTKNIYALFFMILACYMPFALQASIIPMSKTELIQESKYIFVGKVIDLNARWNKKQTLIVTDVTFGISEYLYGTAENTMTLTFGGGTLDGESHILSHVPQFELGDVMLLMVKDDKNPMISPVVGTHLGKFDMLETENRQFIVQQDQGCLHTDPHHDHSNCTHHKHAQKNQSFEDFVKEIKKEIPLAKSQISIKATSPRKANGSLPSLNYNPNAPQNSNTQYQLPQAKPDTPKSQPNIENEVIENELSTPILDENKCEEETASSRWDSNGFFYQDYIIMEPMPSGSDFSFRDQLQMIKWNEYASIFYTPFSPDGEWAYRNGESEIVGFLTDEDFEEAFDYNWDSNALAYCFQRRNTAGQIIEADIIINPSYNWTFDFETAYNNNDIFNIDRTLLHELGHAWGLEHNFFAEAIMNAPQAKYRAFAEVHADDANGIRAAYPSRVDFHTDASVMLYYADGSRVYKDSELDRTTVNVGETFSVSNAQFENVGRNGIFDPTVHWYLVPTMHSWSTYHYLKSTTYDFLLLGGGTFSMDEVFTVPDYLPAGEYYLAAWFSHVDDEVYDNNSAWLDRPISIIRPYCESDGNAGEEWIENVTLLENDIPVKTILSENEGYADFTFETFYLKANNTNESLGLGAGYASYVYPEYWDVYIDFNQDGDFFDAGEHIYNSIDPTSDYFTFPIEIPEDVKLGATRMRIQMSYYGENYPCADIVFGETEDYTVFFYYEWLDGEEDETSYRIENQENLVDLRTVRSKTKSLNTDQTKSFSTRLPNTPVSTTINKFSVYPNPSTGSSTVNASLESTQDASIQIYNSAGQLIQKIDLGKQQLIQEQINLHEHPKGMYFIQLQTAQEQQTTSLILVEE